MIYDCIVIGAGAGGLTAGALLSQAGLKTIILEAEDKAGGYLAGFERNGFFFNTSIEWLSECAPKGFVYDIFKHIGEDFPECTRMARIHRFKNDNSDYLLSSSPLELRDELIRDFPEDKNGICMMFDEAEMLAVRLQALSRKTRSGETKSLPRKLLDGIRMLPLVIPISKYVRTPIDKGLKRFFSSKTALQIFASQETMMSFMVPIAWAFNGNFQLCPSGGSQALVNWLCVTNESYGATIELNSRVEKIEQDIHGKATGVHLANGQKLNAQYVIAACDALTLYDKMLPPTAISEKQRNALRNADIYPSSFSVFLGLDCPASELGFGEETLNLIRSDLKREDYISGNPETTIIIVTSPSERDSGMAPSGKGSLCIHCPACIDYENNWGTEPGYKTGDAYNALKNEFADKLLDRLENEFSTGLREHIEVKEIATPITYWRYTGNTKGSISGVKPTGRNIRAGVARHKTPVKNLLIGGHCGEYGGGIPMAVKSASNASLIILKDLNPQAYQELKSIMSG